MHYFNRKQPHLALIFIVFCYISSIQASHIIGAEINYEYQSGNTYKVIYKLYRKCDELPMNGATFKVSCDDGSNAVTLNPTRTRITDKTPLCSKSALPCAPQNVKTSFGIEEHIYEVTIDFNDNAYSAIKNNCCKAIFSISLCCRNGTITTISPGNFFLESMLNLCVAGNKGNTSPSFVKQPRLTVCCNKWFEENVNIYQQTDADSISFALVPALNGVKSQESYLGSFTPQIPLTPYCPPNPGTLNCKPLPNALPPRGFYYDSINGTIISTPTNCSEVAVIVWKVTQWKKDSLDMWEEIGYVKRELTWFVITCPDNNPPSNTDALNRNVCEGDKLCFTIRSKDDPFLPNQTVADTVLMTWDYGIPAGEFKILDSSAREKQAHFCWQTQLGDYREKPYSFTVNINDDNCPYPLETERVFKIKVKPRSAAIMEYQKGFKGKLVFKLHPVDTINYSFENYRYKVAIRDTTSSGVPLYFDFHQKDSFSFTNPGTYYFEYEINNPPLNCPKVYYDTIQITPEHILSINSLESLNISLYPNPVDGVLFIQSPDYPLNSNLVKIYSIEGKLILEETLNLNSIDVSKLSKGVYLIELQLDQGKVVKQFVKE
ncbi:MAG: T9SS type A sorting domain-containing protein [Bacteroidia bacterium]